MSFKHESGVSLALQRCWVSACHARGHRGSVTRGDPLSGDDGFQANSPGAQTISLFLFPPFTARQLVPYSSDVTVFA